MVHLYRLSVPSTLDISYLGSTLATSILPPQSVVVFCVVVKTGFTTSVFESFSILFPSNDAVAKTAAQSIVTILFIILLIMVYMVAKKGFSV